MSSIQEQQLGQVRNATGGTAEALYSPGADETAIIKSIVVCNTSASADSYRIFLDDDGSVVTEATALFYDVPIGAKETHLINCYLPMDDATGTLSVSCATTNAVTFTAAGAVISA